MLFRKKHRMTKRLKKKHNCKGNQDNKMEI